MTANIPNDPVAIQKFFTSRDNYADANTYVGNVQRLWYNPATNCIYVSDGNTPGGIPVGCCGSGNTVGNISVSDEGSVLTFNVESFNFVGTGVTASNVGNAVTITIPGGIQGVQGIEGSQGVQGVQGIDGQFAGQGVQGVTGAQGAQGAQGISGSFAGQGVQGVQGVTGAQGVQGVQSVQGITGAQGVQGVQGTTPGFGYYGAFHTNYQTALDGGINSNSTAPIAVTSTAGWPTAGALLIEDEVISYTGISGNTFTGIARGIAGSNGATHASGSPVSFAQVAAANTPTTVVIDQTDLSSGVSVNASHEVTIANAGVYNCQFSVQTACADNAPDDIAVWFVVDGTNVPASASYVTTQQIHAGHLGAAIMTVNIFYQFTAGQKLTLQWVTLAGTSVITSYPSVTSPAIPASPSVIFTVNQIA